jgi:hypothetical protein
MGVAGLVGLLGTLVCKQQHLEDTEEQHMPFNTSKVWRS